MPQMSQVLWEHAIGILTAGMSTRAVAHELNVNFFTISHFQRHFLEFGSTSTGLTTADHVYRLQPRTLHIQASFTSKIVRDQPPGQLLQQSVCITKDFLHKLSETVSGKLICMLVVLIGGLDLTAVCHRKPTWVGNAHIQWRLELWRGVLFMEESRFSLYRADGRQRYGVVWVSGFAHVNAVNEWPMVAVGLWYGQGVCYGQWTQVHFIDGILNAQRYRDEILRPIIVPFSFTIITSCVQQDNARPHVARSCTQFLKLKHPSSFMASTLTRDMAPLSMFWDALDRRIGQRVPVPAKNPATSHSHWRGVDQHSTGHNQQPDQLMWRRSVALREANGGQHQIVTGFRTLPIQ